jgi:nicotinamide-nucleotide amidase
MHEMFTRSILPAIREKTGETLTRVTKINTFGMGESILGEKIRDLMTRGANPSVGTTVHDGIVSVRIYATGSPAQTAADTDRIRQVVQERLGSLIFGEDEATIEAATAELLKTRRFTISTAESCTGGLLAKLLTDIAGSSAYFMEGWVTYANAAKQDELGISSELIAAHGAVSELVAKAMAEGARRRSETDFGLATTGVAGPDGGSPEKPVGTVWIALAYPGGTLAQRFTFPGDRSAIRMRASQMALAMLRWHILGAKPPTL